METSGMEFSSYCCLDSGCSISTPKSARKFSSCSLIFTYVLSLSSSRSDPIALANRLYPAIPIRERENGNKAIHPPARLTLYPNAVNLACTLSQWSPWISIVPSLTVPPEPHSFFSCCASAASSSLLAGTPVITVTVFPPRCLRSRITRTIPSLFLAGASVEGWSQRHCLYGCPQTEQVLILPPSVE